MARPTRKPVKDADGVTFYTITRRPEGGPERTARVVKVWSDYRPVPQGFAYRMVPHGRDYWCVPDEGRASGPYRTLVAAVSSEAALFLVRRVDHATVICPLSDEVVARMLVGKLGARCTINGWHWKWKSDGDVVGFLPECVGDHPVLERGVAELHWTLPSHPGTDYDDDGIFSLDRLSSMYFWDGRRYLGRFDSLFEAKVELWEKLDARGYRLSWDGNPGRHPADGTIDFILDPALRAPHNDHSWKWADLGPETGSPPRDDLGRPVSSGEPDWARSLGTPPDRRWS